MMRKPLSGLGSVILLAGLSPLGLGAGDSPPAPGALVRLLGVAPAVQENGTALEVRASGPFTFTSHHTASGNLMVDLVGVVAEPATPSTIEGVSWLSSYRMLPFRNASGRPILRLDISLSGECEVEVTQPAAEMLSLACVGQNRKSAPPATEPVVSSPVVSEEPLLVRRVDVREEAGTVTMEIRANGPLGYETFKLENPPRLVFDLPQTILTAKRRNIAVDSPPVVGIRVAQFKAEPPITRVVVDLERFIPHQANSTDNGLSVVLSSSTLRAENPTAEDGKQNETRPAKKAVAAEPEAVEENSAAQVSPVERTDPEEKDTVSLQPPSPAKGADVRKQVPQVLRTEPQPIVLASLAPAVVPPTPASGEELAPKGAVENVPLLSPPVQDTPPQQEAPAAGQQEPVTVYTGERVDFDLVDVDLKDFFRLIHEISGLNIVLDPNVAGTVTLVLVDVPWDQALDIVLKNNRLGSTLEGNVLRIATLDTLKSEEEERRDLAEAREQAVDLLTVTRQLSYAKAEDLENTLKPFLSNRGDLFRDDRTNTVIIRDVPEAITRTDDLIKQLDRKSLQVEIEARVVSASRAFSRSIGSQLAFSTITTSRGVNIQNVFGGDLGPSPLASPSLPPPLIAEGTDAQQPLFSDLRAVGTTSALLFGHRSPAFALDVILSAAENRQIARILSRPRTVVQNNRPGEILQGARIPIQTVVNNTITTQFIDVALKLTVTPQITADGTVFLDVEIENTAIDPGIARINGIPALSTQKVTSEVLVPDGATLVVGGVMVSRNTNTIDQVPLLGSIPIIGHLFKRTQVETDSQELLFFITPRIMPE